jgi:hypothetical protein
MSKLSSDLILVDIGQTWPLICMKDSTNFTDLITHGSSCKQLKKEAIPVTGREGP